MNKRLLSLVILFFFLFSSGVFACEPYSAAWITIWEYGWKVDTVHPNEKDYRWKDWQMTKEFFDFKDKERLFSAYDKETMEYIIDVDEKSLENNENIVLYEHIWENFYVYPNEIDLDIYEEWDMLVSIARYFDWNYRDYYVVHDTAKIWCKGKDNFFLEKKEWAKENFWTEMWGCPGIPTKNAISEDELLSKIKEKYGTCEGLYWENLKLPWYKRFMNSIVDFFKGIFA